MSTPKFFMDYVAKDPSAASGWRGIGCQMLDELPPGRKTCSEGQQDFTLTEDIELHRGHTLTTVKASKSKPVTGYTIIYPLGGREPWVHPLDRARERQITHRFNENDCGGVFDGNGVVSDADPGL